MSECKGEQTRAEWLHGLVDEQEREIERLRNEVYAYRQTNIEQIERIEQCECADNHIPGMVLGMEVGEDGKCQPEPCPNCDGHGWVKR